METLTDTLISYAKVRLRHLKKGGVQDPKAVKSAERIKIVASYFSKVPSSKHIRCVRQIKEELKYLLPSEESRFQPLRQKILDIIHQSENHDLLETSKTT